MKTIENRQGQKIACIEEIAFNNGWIDEAQLKNQVNLYKKTEYGNYLKVFLKTIHRITLKVKSLFTNLDYFCTN